MGDSSIAEQTSSSHRNTSVNTNAESNFKTPICVWVQRLSGNAPKKKTLADLNDEWFDSFYYPPISLKSCQRSLVVNVRKNGRSAI